MRFGENAYASGKRGLSEIYGCSDAEEGGEGVAGVKMGLAHPRGWDVWSTHGSANRSIF